MSSVNSMGKSLGVRLGCALLVVSAIGGVARAAPLDPTGTWLIQDATARVRIERCGPTGDDVCGYVVWLKTAVDAGGQPRVDAENPDTSKRSRAVLGHQMMLGLSPNAEGKYEGRVYNVENGRSYDITAAVAPADPADLVIHACVMLVLCEDLVWKRAVDVVPGQLTGPTGSADGPQADAEWAQTIPRAAARPWLPPRRP